MISYGYSVKEHDDPLVDIVEAATRQFSESVEHGAFVVDMVPLRKLRFLHQLIAGSTECTLAPPTQHIPVIDTQLRLVPSCPSCVSLIGPGVDLAHGADSAIRAGLVPWNGVEIESQAVRRHVERDGGYTLSIRKGSDGELVSVLKRLFSPSFLRSSSLRTVQAQG